MGKGVVSGSRSPRGGPQSTRLGGKKLQENIGRWIKETRESVIAKGITQSKRGLKGDITCRNARGVSKFCTVASQYNVTGIKHTIEKTSSKQQRVPEQWWSHCLFPFCVIVYVHIDSANNQWPDTHLLCAVVRAHPWQQCMNSNWVNGVQTKKYNFGSLLTPNDLILDGTYNKWLRKNLAKFQIVGVGVD